MDRPAAMSRLDGGFCGQLSLPGVSFTKEMPKKITKVKLYVGIHTSNGKILIGEDKTLVMLLNYGGGELS